MLLQLLSHGAPKTSAPWSRSAPCCQLFLLAQFENRAESDSWSAQQAVEAIRASPVLCIFLIGGSQSGQTAGAQHPAVSRLHAVHLLARRAPSHLFLLGSRLLLSTFPHHSPFIPLLCNDVGQYRRSQPGRCILPLQDAKTAVSGTYCVSASPLPYLEPSSIHCLSLAHCEDCAI